jgi:hypothetical protein
LFGHHHGAHRSVLKYYNRRAPGITTSGQIRKGAIGRRFHAEVFGLVPWAQDRGSFEVTVLDCNTRTVFTTRGRNTVAIRTRGLVFRKYVWFNRTEAIKALEIGVWFVFGFLRKTLYLGFF